MELNEAKKFKLPSGHKELKIDNIKAGGKKTRKRKHKKLKQ